jgi:hypothetical protein
VSKDARVVQEYPGEKQISEFEKRAHTRKGKI